MVMLLIYIFDIFLVYSFHLSVKVSTKENYLNVFILNLAYRSWENCKSEIPGLQIYNLGSISGINYGPISITKSDWSLSEKQGVNSDHCTSLTSKPNIYINT